MPVVGRGGKVGKSETPCRKGLVFLVGGGIFPIFVT